MQGVHDGSEPAGVPRSFAARRPHPANPGQHGIDGVTLSGRNLLRQVSARICREHLAHRQDPKGIIVFMNSPRVWPAAVRRAATSSSDGCATAWRPIRPTRRNSSRRSHTRSSDQLFMRATRWSRCSVTSSSGGIRSRASVIAAKREGRVGRVGIRLPRGEWFLDDARSRNLVS